MVSGDLKFLWLVVFLFILILWDKFFNCFLVFLRFLELFCINGFLLFVMFSLEFLFELKDGVVVLFLSYWVILLIILNKLVLFEYERFILFFKKDELLFFSLICFIRGMFVLFLLWIMWYFRGNLNVGDVSWLVLFVELFFCLMM